MKFLNLRERLAALTELELRLGVNMFWEGLGFSRDVFWGEMIEKSE